MEKQSITFMIANKKTASPKARRYQNIEFSHVNGPKDQAGGCLADLLFCFINILIYCYPRFCQLIFFKKFIEINYLF